jgi:nucleotide-binding universal stress UspA family protein
MEDVLRAAAVPVVVVPDGYHRRWWAAEPLRVLVALDGTDLAEAALAPACELAAMAEGELVLVRVVAPSHDVESYAFPVGDAAGMLARPTEYLPHLQARVDQADAYLSDAADRLRGLVQTVRTRVEVGGVEDGLVGAAAATGAHVIAMATHRRGELTRLLLGSHAIATLRRADVPVMVVRPAVSAAQDGFEPGDPVPRGSVSIQLDVDELDLVRCGLNRLLDDPNAGEEVERSVFALEDRLSNAVKHAEPPVTVG